MKKLIPSLAIYCLILLGVEFAGRVYISISEKKNLTSNLTELVMSLQEPFMGFGLKKNLETSMGSWSVTTNRLGFRGTEPTPAQRNIFVVGGSTVFGWGVPEKETIPFYMQEIISKKHPEAKVFNMGIPWYSSSHEMALILYRLIALKPTAIWVLDGLNDSAQAVAPSWKPNYLGYVDAASELLFQGEKSGFDKLLRLSQTFTYFRGKLHQRKSIQTGVFHEEAAIQYAQYHSMVATVLKSKNIPYRVFFQPVMSVHKPVTSFEDGHNGTSMKLPEFRNTFVKQYLALESALSQNKTISSYSLKSIFEKESDTVYLDGLHYNAWGNKTIAQKIIELQSDDINSFFL